MSAYRLWIDGLGVSHAVLNGCRRAICCAEVGDRLSDEASCKKCVELIRDRRPARETPAHQPPPEGWAVVEDAGAVGLAGCGFVYGIYTGGPCSRMVWVDSDGLNIDGPGMHRGQSPEHVAIHVLTEAARLQGDGW